MEELNVMETVDVAEVMEDCVEAVSSGDGKTGKILAAFIGGGIALGTAIGIVVHKNKKTDKPKKLSWWENRQIKNLEKKGYKVEKPVTEEEPVSESVEDNE